MRSISRRTAIQGITVVGGLLVIGRARLVEAQTPLVRLDVNQLANEPDELKRFQEAVRALKGKMTPGAKSAWQRNAELHGDYCGRKPGVTDIHGTWWFLPWHRAYLHATERNLQQALGDPKVALPYWHWPLTPRIPEIYKTGPLDQPQRYATPIDAWRFDLTNMGAPSFRGQWENNSVKEQAFGGNSAQGKPTSSIEGTPHGAIHNAVGVDMGQLSKAAYDPIFFAHHANIDRLWEVWRGPSDSAHALSEPWDVDGFTTENGTEIAWDFFDVDSNEQPYRVSAAKTRNTVDLGYTYSKPPKPTQIPASPTIAFDEVSGGSRPQPSASLLGKQAKTSAVQPSGKGDLQSFAPGGSAGRAILTLQDVEVPAESGADLAVYLSNNTTFKPDEAVYAGAIGVVATGSHPTKATFSLDVTDALKRLRPSGKTINVTVVPIRRTESDPEPKPLEVGKIDLYAP